MSESSKQVTRSKRPSIGARACPPDQPRAGRLARASTSIACESHIRPPRSRGCRNGRKLLPVRTRRRASTLFAIHAAKKLRALPQNRNLSLDSYIPIMPCIFLSIPEGVSVMTVTHRWGGCGACGLSETNAMIPGSPGAALRTLGSARREAVRQPEGVADVQFQEAKTAAKAWTRASRHSRTNRPAYLRELASTQPFASFLPPRKRHYRFHPGRSYAQRSLTSESVIFQPHPEVRAGGAGTHIPQDSGIAANWVAATLRGPAFGGAPQGEGLERGRRRNAKSMRECESQD